MTSFAEGVHDEHRDKIEEYLQQNAVCKKPGHMRNVNVTWEWHAMTPEEIRVYEAKKTRLEAQEAAAVTKGSSESNGVPHEPPTLRDVNEPDES